MDRHSDINTYHEFYDEIPHLENGIHSLDQSLESTFEAPSPPHEFMSTSSGQEDPMNDVIERIERLNLDSTSSQSMDKIRQYYKFPPMWLTKILLSTHPIEAKKIRT